MTTRLQVLDPAGEPLATPAAMAPRLKSLKGLRIGLLENSKPNAGKFLDMLEALLDREYGFAAVVRHRKPSASRVAPDEILADLAARTDAVLVGMGD
jgi:hypothetical protein